MGDIMNIEITYDLIRYVMGHWLLYLLFFCVGYFLGLLTWVLIKILPRLKRLAELLDFYNKFKKDENA